MAKTNCDAGRIAFVIINSLVVFKNYLCSSVFLICKMGRMNYVCYMAVKCDKVKKLWLYMAENPAVLG